MNARLIACCILTTALCASADAGEAVRGSVRFSDGAERSGLLSLTRSAAFEIHVGSGVRSVPITETAEIRFAPESETMEQKWRFPVAGQTRKVKWGDPYPVRHIAATLRRVDGEVFSGRLVTTVLYIEEDGKVSKIILRSKQRGEEGETLADLVHPVSVVFDVERTDAEEHAVRLRERGPVLETAALLRDGLARVACREKDGTLFLDEPLDALFVAARTQDGISAAFPANADDDLRARTATAVAEAKDFFDRRELLAVHRDGEGRVFALVLLRREGGTTLAAKANRPWRLGVWRFVEDAESGTLMLAGRGRLLRGILPPGAAPPPVTVRALEDMFPPDTPKGEERP